MYLTHTESNDYDLIRQLAGQAIPSPIVNIQRLPGSMAFNYEINHQYIFKLPHEWTPTKDWQNQALLAPVLQRHLTFQVPQPRLKTVCLSDNRAVLSSSYPKMEGSCLSQETFAAKDRSFKTRFFEQLSDAAAQIHSIALSELPFQPPTKTEYLENGLFSNAAENHDLPKKLFHQLMNHPSLGLGKYNLRTSLLAHTDLHPGNVLLNDKNELVALLDFETSVRGDRFLEFRPHLYPDVLDLRLFQRVYQDRTGIQIDVRDVYQQEIVQSSLSWFYHLYQLYRYAKTPVRDKKMKQAFKLKIESEGKGARCL